MAGARKSRRDPDAEFRRPRAASLPLFALSTASPDTTVRCWGANEHGQLGDGTTHGRLTPVAVAVAGLSGVVRLSARSGRPTEAGDEWAHVCAALDDGSAVCWGSNDSGQLGDGTTTERHTPVPVVGLDGVADIDAGPLVTCAVLVDGTAWCWGQDDGYLGIGGDPVNPLPRRIGAW